MQTEQTAGPSAPAAGGQGHNQLASGSLTPVSRQVGARFFFYSCHYNFSNFEKCHYNSSILKFVIIILYFFEPYHFIHL